ncbi:gastric inhibitory polypeptide receptor isoform X2 [Alligator mississippiensis]|uniref:gastric inhibitory polypeptide receptor isoform X2 n=1 Tax=Alligator mississippiensis TaxID=8496 RepID=UPI002877CF92|nr:gastric inhibitory polypeptide receptor isoform X2 [Alligator mississippiensis]
MWLAVALALLWAALMEAGGVERSAADTVVAWREYRQECERRLRDQPPALGLVCNRTFDMYACWDDATPNTTARVPCPWYLPWHHHVRDGSVLRRCGPDGRWVAEPGGPPWHDNAQCEAPAPELPLQAAPLHPQPHPRAALRLLRAPRRCRPGPRRAAAAPPRAPPAAPGRPPRAAGPGRGQLPPGAGADPVRGGRQPLLAAGRGAAPPRAAGAAGHRGRPPARLPAAGLGDPGAVRGPLGRGAVPLREHAVLGADRQPRALVDRALPPPAGRAGELRAVRAHPAGARGQAAGAARALPRLQAAAGPLDADAGAAARQPRAAVRAPARGAARGPALRAPLPAPLPQLLPGAARQRPLLLPQQGGAGRAAAAVAAVPAGPEPAAGAGPGPGLQARARLRLRPRPRDPGPAAARGGPGGAGARRRGPARGRALREHLLALAGPLLPAPGRLRASSARPAWGAPCGPGLPVVACIH